MALTLRKRNIFNCQGGDIFDIVMLQKNLMLLADGGNITVKLFDTEGNNIDNLPLESKPARLAVIGETAGQIWTVAATQLEKCAIAIFTVTPQSISFERSVDTSPRKYWAMTRVGPDMLAVGYRHGQGVDIIDFSGNLLRTLPKAIHPFYIVVTPSRRLVMSNWDVIWITELDTGDGSPVSRIPGEQIKVNNPSDMVPNNDGSLIVADRDRGTLNLLGPGGEWIRVLATVDANSVDQLYGVSMLQEVAVCCTRKGTVTVFDAEMA